MYIFPQNILRLCDLFQTFVSCFQCTLTVTDNGDPSLRSDKIFKINFVNNKGQPQFDKNAASKDFHEDTEEEKWIVEPEAIDPFPEGYKRDLYYFIIGEKFFICLTYCVQNMILWSFYCSKKKFRSI